MRFLRRQWEKGGDDWEQEETTEELEKEEVKGEEEESTLLWRGRGDHSGRMRGWRRKEEVRNREWKESISHLRE